MTTVACGSGRARERGRHGCSDNNQLKAAAEETTAAETANGGYDGDDNDDNNQLKAKAASEMMATATATATATSTCCEKQSARAQHRGGRKSEVAGPTWCTAFNS